MSPLREAPTEPHIDPVRRRLEGVVYTPPYIIRHMIQITLGRFLSQKQPWQIGSLKILDPACGTGLFLIEAFRFLMDWHRECYLLALKDPASRQHKFSNLNNSYSEGLAKQHPNGRNSHRENNIRDLSQKLVLSAAGSWDLSIQEKKHILTQYLYGIDIDKQSVILTRQALLQQVFENESPGSAQLDPLLNIQCRNALIPSEFIPPESDDFDIIIGNPPYIKEYINKAAFAPFRASPYYQGKMDLWTLFASHAIDQLKPNGYFSFIAPNNWITNHGARLFRNKMLTEGEFEHYIDFGNAHVFKDALIQTMLYVFRKRSPRKIYAFPYLSIPLHVCQPLEIETHISQFTDSNFSSNLSDMNKIEPSSNTAFMVSFKPEQYYDSSISFLPSDIEEILSHIEGQNKASDSRPRIHLKPSEIGQGIIIPQDVVLASHQSKLKAKPEMKADVKPFLSIKDGLKSSPPLRGRVRVGGEYPSLIDIKQLPVKPAELGIPEIGKGIFVLTTEQVDSLNLSELEKTLIKPFYTPREMSSYTCREENRLWLIYTLSNMNQQINDYPNIKAHLDQYQAVLTSDFKPYGLHRARKETWFTQEKILCLRKCQKPTFTWLPFESYVSQTYNMIQTPRVSLQYLTALLNSTLMAFWFRYRGKMQGLNYQIDQEPLLRVPIISPTCEELAWVLEHFPSYSINPGLKSPLPLRGRARVGGEHNKIGISDDDLDNLNDFYFRLYGLNTNQIQRIMAAMERHSKAL